MEITDLLWPVDADGVPVPVMKADVLDRLTSLGQRRAARIVSAIPAADGILDQGYVDALGLRVHTASTLHQAAQIAAPGYDIQVLEGSRWHPRALDVLRPIVGTLP